MSRLLSSKKISGFFFFAAVFMFSFAFGGYALAQEIEVNTTTVSVPEGGSTPVDTLRVRLTVDPGGTLTVTGDNNSGDADIQPSPTDPCMKRGL